MTRHDGAHESEPDEASSAGVGVGEGAHRESIGYTRRQVIAASLAALLLGVGAGMAYTTKSWVDRDRGRDRPTAVDLGFVNDMLDHHDQAVEMSLIALGRPGISGSARNFATEIIVFQRYEIGLLQGRLNVWGEEQGEEERTAMAWMGMGTKVADMPGMASPADLEKLKVTTGTEADRQFFTLMLEHHKGGVHMADYAATHAADGEVVALASRMSYNQKLEITEYTRALTNIT